MIVLPLFIYRNRCDCAPVGPLDIESMKKKLRELAPIMTKMFDDARAVYDGVNTH